MIFKSITLVFLIPLIYTLTYGETYVHDCNLRDGKNELEVNVGDKVHVDVYYETWCPDCKEFMTGDFKKAVIYLEDYLDIHTYPYGKTKTNKTNGVITFTCMFGPGECYGNKLDACALDKIQNKTQGLLFNICMMESNQSNQGSDDAAADKCAASMNIDAESIKSCAKDDEGTQLLNYYGELSEKVGYKYVPYILVNGKESFEDTFIKDICNAIPNPPPHCSNN